MDNPRHDRLTVVVAACNEAEALPLLHPRIRAALAGIAGLQAGVLYVDDGSRDDTWRVWAYCDVANTRSARVMEKAGLTYEGTLRRWAVIGDAVPVDCRVYARVRDAAPE